MIPLNYKGQDRLVRKEGRQGRPSSKRSTHARPSGAFLPRTGDHAPRPRRRPHLDGLRGGRESFSPEKKRRSPSVRAPSSSPPAGQSHGVRNTGEEGLVLSQHLSRVAPPGAGRGEGFLQRGERRYTAIGPARKPRGAIYIAGTNPDSHAYHQLEDRHRRQDAAEVLPLDAEGTHEDRAPASIARKFTGQGRQMTAADVIQAAAGLKPPPEEARRRDVP